MAEWQLQPLRLLGEFRAQCIHTGYFQRGAPTHGGCHQPQQRLPEHCDAGCGSDRSSGNQPRHLVGGISSGQRRAHDCRCYSLCRSGRHAKRRLGEGDSERRQVAATLRNSEPNTNSNGHSNTYSYRDGNSYTHADSYADEYADPASADSKAAAHAVSSADSVRWLKGEK